MKWCSWGRHLSKDNWGKGQVHCPPHHNEALREDAKKRKDPNHVKGPNTMKKDGPHGNSLLNRESKIKLSKRRLNKAKAVKVNRRSSLISKAKTPVKSNRFLRGLKTIKRGIITILFGKKPTKSIKCVYAFVFSNHKNQFIKIGKTDDLDDAISKSKRYNYEPPIVVDFIECENPQPLEAVAHSELFSRNVKEGGGTEFFNVSEGEVKALFSKLKIELK